MKKTISMKIRELRKDRKLTQQQVADAIGISRVAVSKWESGETKDLKRDSLIGLSVLFNVTLNELLDAETTSGAAKNITQGITIPRHSSVQDINVEPGPNISGKVPLISWVQAGAFCQAPDLFAPGDAEEWLLSVQKLGPHAYALRVNGDSMTAPYGRSYPDGCIIFVDPDCPITNGCRVIAKLPDTNEATFKCYVEDAGKKFLKPLNPQYPTIEITDTMLLCGVVKGYYMPD